jgi:lipoprotein-anchoring transpeptidase ErfK/SrfK
MDVEMARRIGKRLLWPATAALVALALSPIAAVAGASSSSGSHHRDVTLSNEWTFTTWAVANYSAAVRVKPNAHARRLTKLRTSTPDGYLESFILLQEHWTGSQAWVKLRVPGRPNGRTGWVLRNALSGFNVTHKVIVVSRKAEQLVLYDHGHRIFSAPVGVGKPSTPTPPGHFWITEAFPSSDPFYGPYAFATSDYSTLTEWPGGGIVGLHGTNEPSLIPGDPSHGCIRLHNSDVLKLKHLISIGTPLHVK